MNMKTMNRYSVRVILLAVSIASSGISQPVTKVGTTAAKFLSIPVGSRAIGMGGAFTGIANDASAMYWNPGGIARIYQTEAVFYHSDWIADIKFNYGGVVIPVGSLGTVGLSFTSVSMDDMERTTELQPEGTSQFFSAGSFAVAASYAKNLTDWFSIGGTVKYVNEHIWNSSATGFAVDIGTLFSTPFPGLTFGAGISNFGTKMNMTGDDLLVPVGVSNNSGSNQNINARLATDDFDLPLTLRIGLAYQPLNDEDQQLTFAVDAYHPNDNSESINIGGEYIVFERIVALRAGYKGLGLKGSEEELTLGAGLNYEITPGLRLKFDYAFQKFGRLSNVNNFAVSVVF
ncbi:MAG: PorV/PorQ family protein [Bacteroidetes bacterium]|nr:PorV/PorQ family protein [Bacteroidota bacterium]MCW5896024.1 PorV/PorQ family protein [Bacteroidota bacterium]